MSEPRYKQGDAVVVAKVGAGVICSEPEYEYKDEAQTEGEWTYLVSFNEINDNGWFGESEMTGVVMDKDEPTMSEQYESPLVTKIIEEMAKGFLSGDVEAIDELLRFCPRINLIQYGIPEEEWEKWLTKEELADIYDK